MGRSADDGGMLGGILVHQIAEVLERLGVDREGLCAIVGRDLALLDDPWARLPRDVAPRLFAYAEHRTGDPAIGLHAGEQGRFRGPLAHLLASAPTLRAALEVFVRFSTLAVESSRMRLDVRGDTAALVANMGRPSDAPGEPHLLAYSLVGALRTMWRIRRPGSALRALHFRHEDRGEAREAERIFGCPVYFEKPDDRMVFPARDLETPLHSANRLVGLQLQKALVALPATPEMRDGFAARVEEAIRTLVVCGRRAEEAAVAKHLHVSVRSLQRRLRDERTSFRAVRDDVLRGLAEAQLGNPDLSIKEIAMSLGFADAAALTKAFRRWTGEPPTAFRERALRPAPHRRAAPAARTR
jgi:AraC-like DNA-binding protein